VFSHEEGFMRGILLALLITTTSAWGYLPARFVPFDVGLSYPDSQSVRCDPRDGTTATQYVAISRLEYLHFVLMPKLLRALRDGCGATANNLVAVPRDQEGKFWGLYSIRPLCARGPFEARPNYLWDVPQNLLARLRACVQKHPEVAGQTGLDGPWLTMLGLAPTPAMPPPACTVEPAIARLGTLDPKHAFAPLSAETCAALDAVATVHAAQGAAFLAGDLERAGQLGPDVRAGQVAVVRTARDAWEANLLDMQFTGDIDPKSPADRTRRLTEKLLAAHHAWHAAMGCGTGRPPSLVKVWLARYRHNRAHYLRALWFPGIAMRDACSLDCSTYIGNCLQSGE
jgi:hypothetical protein